jgi:hypothetical protein
MTCANPKLRQISRPFRVQANTMKINIFYNGWLALNGQKSEGLAMFALFIQKNKLYYRVTATRYLPA